MAEGQILFDPINVGWIDEYRFTQRPAAFGIFALQQMAFASAVAQDFAGAGDFETLGYCFPGFDSLGTSHNDSLSLNELEIDFRAQVPRLISNAAVNARLTR